MTDSYNQKDINLASESDAGIELMVGPFDFRGGSDYGFNPALVAPVAPPVEAYVTSRSIGTTEFNAFRMSPAIDPSRAQWSYTLPRRNTPAGAYSITLTLEYSDSEPAPSFAGLLAVGLADQPDDLSAVAFPVATDVQVQSVGNDSGPLLSVLEWQFDNPAGSPFVACVLTKPSNPPFAGIIYLYQATLSFLGE